MKNISIVLSIILAGLIMASACSALQVQQYEINKPSPNGLYRAKVMVKRGQRGQSLDEAKFQFLVGEEVVDSWEWKQEDQYDENFDSYLPVEWIDERVLQIGGRVSRDTRFSDELDVTNDSGEHLKYLNIGYDKRNIFMIFDLGPGTNVNLSVRPWFTVPGGEFSFGYEGVTRAGKHFVGIIKVGERTYPDGPKKIALRISPEQIH